MRLPAFPSPLLPPVLRLGLYVSTNPRAHIQSLESPLRLLRAISRLGAEGAVPVPPELLPTGARVLSQGYLNRVAITRMDGWLLPNWMRAQSDPASPVFAPRSVTNLLVNVTERSWTALGLPGERHPVEGIVDRSGLLTPVPGGPSLDWWVELARREGGNDRVMVPSRHEVSQRMQGGVPVVLSAFEAQGLRVQSEAWMLSLPGSDWAAMQIVLFNIADMPLRGTFRFALRPYNPEGISPIYSLSYDGRSLFADGRPGPFTWPRPEGWRLSSLRGGDLYNAVSGPPVRGEAGLYDPHGLANAVLEYSFRIEPWEEAEFLAFLPVHTHPAGQQAGSPELFSVPYPEIDNLPHPLPHPQAYSRVKAATTLEWRSLLDSGMRLSVPHRDLQESWEANRGHLLALHDGDTITPGPDLYHDFWFRDAAFMVQALSTHGYVEAARQLLRGFLRRQRPDGSFTSQSSEWDGTGQVLWALRQHLEMHPDPALLAEAAPAIERGARFLMQMLHRWGGLMPPGISSEHFGPPDRYYWDDFWSLAGLRAARHLLNLNWAFVAAADLHANLSARLAKDAALCGGALPGARGRCLDLSAVGSLVAWHPLDIISPDSSYLTNTLSALEENLFYEGALFMNTGHSGWGSYVNMRIAACYALIDPERAWQLTLWLLRHASPTYNWPEAIHTRTKGGSTGDGHHGWASAEWLLLVRSLLLREEGSTLFLTPALPESWLQTAGRVEVEAAPTRFGTVGYTVEWDDGGRNANVRFSAEWRNPPARLLWGLPGRTRERSIALDVADKLELSTKRE